MSAENEAVVRRYYEEMATGGKTEIAGELFTDDHQFHDPHVPTGPGPQGMVDALKPYHENVEPRWDVEDIFSAGDRVAVRWIGSGKHVGTINGVPATGNAIRVDAVTIHRMKDGKIAETWEVWDTLTFLQQIGAVPSQ